LGVGALLWPLMWGPPKMGLYKEWARAGPWARGQIDTFKEECFLFTVFENISHN